MKLPITPLLYLVSLASLGGIVHTVIQYKHKTVYDEARRRAIRVENEKFRKDALSKTVGDQRWDYRSDRFWNQLRDANFIGRVEKKVEEDPGKAVTQPEKKPEIVDLNTVFEVICITSAGDQTGVVINYKTDVQVPEGLLQQPSAPINTVPAGRRNRAMPQPQPTTVGAPPHHLRIGDKLWPNYDHISLKSVAPDASYVLFELKLDDKKDKDGNYPEQRMFKSVLGLPAGIHEMLLSVGKGAAAAQPGKDGDAGKPGADAPKVPDSTWVDTPDTTISRDGRVNVARKDQRFLEQNGADIFNNDVHMGDYSGGRGDHRIRGVQVRKLSNRVRQFGVNEGDVIISINGTKVTGMANAKKVGRRLYSQGVRDFRAEILRQGRIITRTYSFKK